MTAKDDIDRRARAAANGKFKKGRISGAMKGQTVAGIVTGTDLGHDLELLENELKKKVLPKSVKRVNTVVRKAVVARLRLGGGPGAIGRSLLTRTRGTELVNGRNGQYWKNGWSAKVVKKRGAYKPSMAINAGDRPDSKHGIKSKQKQLASGLIAWGITGPTYGPDDKENSRYGHNHAHTHEPRNGASSGAPKHKAWGRRSGGLPARPFMKPAADASLMQQKKVVTESLKKWKTT